MVGYLPQTRGAWVRVSVIFGMAALVVYYFVLTISNREAIDSRINASVLTVSAQIDGMVVDGALTTGKTVATGTEVLRLRAERIDDRTLVELREALQGNEARVRGLERERDELLGLRETLAQRRRSHADQMRARIVAEGAEYAATLAGLRESAAQANEALHRGSNLVGKGFISQSRQEELQHDQRRAQAEIARVQALLDQNRVDQAAIAEGVTLSGNYADIPYTTQRIDEIDLRRIALDREIADQTAAHTQLQRRFDAESERIALASEQATMSPVNGVVWRARSSTGNAVLRGEPVVSIVDCGRVFVEATVYERFLDRIALGQPARVTMVGDDRDLPARVSTILGSAAALPDDDRVAVPMRKNPGEATIVLELDASALAAEPMCGVGRSTKVRFLSANSGEAQAATR